jgi:hypothetical protein
MNPCPPSTPRVMQTQTPPTRRKRKTDPDDPPRNQRKKEPNHQRERRGGRKGGNITTYNGCPQFLAYPFPTCHITGRYHSYVLYNPINKHYRHLHDPFTSHHTTQHRLMHTGPVPSKHPLLQLHVPHRVPRPGCTHHGPRVHASQPVFNVFLSLVSVRWMDSVKVIF